MESLSLIVRKRISSLAALHFRFDFAGRDDKRARDSSRPRIDNSDDAGAFAWSSEFFSEPGKVCVSIGKS
jgi:hypothetical protein